ncbi:MAG: DUF1508 domain-containing protein [Bacteroidetes bacterium]|nr:DUF1508 domain-containing protein [Bacteroidota bacterium]
MQFKITTKDSEEGYVFQIINNDGPVVSRGSFDTQEQAIEGLKYLIAEIKKGRKFEIINEKDKYFFSIKDEDGFEYGKSILFDSQSVSKKVATSIREGISSSSDFEVILITKSTEKIPVEDVPTPTRGRYDLSYLSQSGKSGFELFKNPSNKAFYFHFIDKDGNVLLFSRGYLKKTSRDFRVNSIIKNVKAGHRYESFKAEEGYYFIFKSKIGREIAKSRFFETEEKMKAAIKYLRKNAAKYTKKYKVSKKTKKSAKSGSDSTKKFGLLEKVKSKRGGIIPYRDKKTKFFYFHVNDVNGNPFLFSKYFSKRNGRDYRILSLCQNVGKEDRYKKIISDDGYAFLVVSRIGREVAKSRIYSTESEMNDAISYLKTIAPEYVKSYKKKAKKSKKRKKGKEPAVLLFDLKQSSHSNEPSFVSFQNPKNNFFYFHVNDNDGEPFLFSHAYKSKNGRDNALKSIRKNAQKDRWYSKRVTSDGYLFFIQAKNGKQIARSRFFATEEEMENAIVFLRSESDPSPKFVEKEKRHTEIFTLTVDETEVIPAPIILSAEESNKEKAAAIPVIAPPVAAAAEETITPAPIVVPLEEPEEEIVIPPPVVVPPVESAEELAAPAPVAAPHMESKTSSERGWFSRYWLWLLLFLIFLLLLWSLRGCFTNKEAVGVIIPEPTEELKPVVIVKEVPIVLPEIYYDYDQPTILSNENTKLNQVLGIMEKHSDILIEIGSHTDSRGSDEYNIVLSQNRATEAKKWLTDRGIEAERLKDAGYGETRLRNECSNGVVCTDDQHRENRRTEFKIIGGKTVEKIAVED